jgi:hypothetical protein
MASRKDSDYIKPLILVYAGILASSVAIVVGFAAAIASKEVGVYRPALAHGLAPMAVVVIIATIAVVILQVLRGCWLAAPALPDSSPFRNMKMRWSFRGGVAAVFLFFAWQVLSPGYLAAKYIATGLLTVSEGNSCAAPLSDAERGRLPWVLRRFYSAKAVEPCRPEKTAA